MLLALSAWSDAAVLRNSTAQLDEKSSGAVFRRVRRNAHPCVQTGCKWPKSDDGKVYVPYKIDRSFPPCSHVAIWFIMDTFSKSTCVRFVPRIYPIHPDFLNIQKSASVSQSDVGRQRGAQRLFLTEADSYKLHVVQHELLHSLGFVHEFSRSDRDQFFRVNWDNIDPNAAEQFVWINTLNLDTPIDPSSVMNYGRFAGSVNGSPTLEAVPGECHDKLEFGTATEMSQTDIDRVNRLYCQSPSALERLLAAILILAGSA